MKHSNEREDLMNRAMRAALRARRAALGLDIKDVAERAGIPERTMSRYLNGTSELYYSVLVQIAGAMSTTVEQLARDAMRLTEDEGFRDD